MSKKPSWAIRITYITGRIAFLRRDGIGLGPIVTFYDHARAETEAEKLRQTLEREKATVTVIERSHGRRDLTPPLAGGA